MKQPQLTFYLNNKIKKKFIDNFPFKIHQASCQSSV